MKNKEVKRYKILVKKRNIVQNKSNNREQGRNKVMETKTHKSMIKLHTHTHTHTSAITLQQKYMFVQKLPKMEMIK